MKKLIILTCLLITTPVFSACAIDGSSTACSIAKIQEPQQMHRTYAPASTIKEFSDTPEARLQPSRNNLSSRQLRDFGPQTADYSYNTSCQFGICNPSGAPQLFEPRR